MKIKTSELNDTALNWAVAKCEGKVVREEYLAYQGLIRGMWGSIRYKPSTSWAQGGPIIDREAISLTQFSDYPKWTAKHPGSLAIDGTTPLIAAMRCYVASKLGDEVDIPEDLT